MGYTTETTFAVEAFRRGIEDRDTNALLDLYDDNAEIRIVDRTSPPSSPRVLRGRQAIAEYLTDVNGRDMTHHLERGRRTGGLRRVPGVLPLRRGHPGALLGGAGPRRRADRPPGRRPGLGRVRASP